MGGAGVNLAVRWRRQTGGRRRRPRHQAEKKQQATGLLQKDLREHSL
jgi:hypothetical protein